MKKEIQKIWSPASAQIESSELYRFRTWVNHKYGLQLRNYQQLYEWSIDLYVNFWQCILEYFEMEYSGIYSEVCSNDPMPYVRWFDGIQLNYAEHLFKNKADTDMAFISFTESSELRYTTWGQLKGQVASVQKFYKSAGLQKGDRVVAYCSNILETSVCMLAAVASGLVWSSCSPDFGVSSALDRFKQIEPIILVAVTAYSYGGKVFDKTSQIQELISGLKNLKKVLWIESCDIAAPKFENDQQVAMTSLMNGESKNIQFERVAFSDPIWVLYSSGTTGLPKPIVHGHGGMLLEHYKYTVLQNDIRKGERFFWYSTTGWMMWNFVHASLLAGATAVLYDGSPGYPKLDSLWQKCAELKMHHFGTSAPFLVACMKENLEPGVQFDLGSLRSIGSTGSPLPAECFDWVYRAVKEEVWLCSMSGGTDVCTAFVGSCIERPVYAGQIQCRALGAAVQAWDDSGRSVNQEVGEMVITRPMPCMPVFFWNDQGFEKYISSYFEMYPGVWRHGDWIEITAEDGVIIHGRSDATLNRQGVRMGTAEFYSALNELEEIADALVVNLEKTNGEHFMPLFVQLKSGVLLNDELRKKINTCLRLRCSPRHVPDEIFVCPDIPYTISGKKMEGPVKKVLLKADLKKAYNPDAMRNPLSMQYFITNVDSLSGN
ncbi:MAG: acetoacetate--CoA ligase [Saprospiraceae bacterium]|nr:acetoacetate--CoA ligase [Saprospiraceae bacterium]